MKRLVFSLIAIVLIAAPLSAATTVSGRVGPNSDRVWGFVPFGDGQTLITLTWAKKSADLFVVLSCSSGDSELIFGVGAAVQDRIQRIEAGAFGDACSISVSSFSGSASFRLSVESSVGDELTQRAAGGDAVPVRFRLVPMEVSDFPGLADELARVRALR